MNSAGEILRRDFGGDIIEPDAEHYQAVSGSLLARGDPAVVLRTASAGDVQAGWVDYLRDAPDELTATAEFANPFAGGPEAPVEIHIAFDGDDPHRAARAIDPIRRLGTASHDDVALVPYPDTLEEAGAPQRGPRDSMSRKASAVRG